MKKIMFAFLLIACFTACSTQAQPETLVLIKTSYGDITVKLYNDTPIHRDNFLKLVREGWYNGSPFHRVINNFMIQGGQNANGKLDPGYTVEAEFVPTHFHKKGALAAARMGDNVNPQKRSSGSQFYIVQGQKCHPAQLEAMSARTGFKYTDAQKQVYSSLGGTPHLDGSYTVFGEVIDGFEVIDKIAAVETGRGDVPTTPVTMTMEILE